MVLPSKGLWGEMLVGVLTGLSSIGVQLSEVPAVDLADAPAAKQRMQSLSWTSTWQVYEREAFEA